MKRDYEKLLQKVRENLGDDNRFKEKLVWIDNMITAYAKKLEVSKYEVLSAFEKNRTYWSANYYQPSNQPELKEVTIYKDRADFKKVLSKGTICPKCKKISTSFTTCSDTKCGWSSGGLFGTLGQGHKFMIKELFLEGDAKVFDIFMPVAIAKKEEEVDV